MQNVVCVKWGQKFSPAYVNNLYKSVVRNTKESITFYCLTDDSIGLLNGIEVIHTPFPEIWGWWQKLLMFSPGFPVQGRFTFLDLDTLITGNIDNILKVDTGFWILRDAYHPEGLQSSIMNFDNTDPRLHCIWNLFAPKHAEIHKKMYPYGDQVWIQQHLNQEIKINLWQDHFKEEIQSFKVQVIPKGRLPHNCKMIFYHGKPSIPESMNIPGFAWVKKYWK